MPFYFDVKQSQNDAEEESKFFNKTNFNSLLNVYKAEMKARLDFFGGQESNIPLGDVYYILRNKHQYVHAKFTKE